MFTVDMFCFLSVTSSEVASKWLLNNTTMFEFIWPVIATLFFGVSFKLKFLECIFRRECLGENCCGI